ncbi:MAG: TonB-dependent receptor plug domain-containing protein, partial [Rhodothermales bacterium]|nr:TonB-dependent receptor plug domain-containing protein [Rhodothermales bacterium]
MFSPSFLPRIAPVCLLLAAAPVAAQSEADSLREYELGEVVVGDRAESGATPSTVQRIPLAEIDRLDAVSVAGAARLIPAAHVQTNSRGESLLYLRAAGERQVALFFDGALLNVPWDNRLDLSLVPSPVVGTVTVAKGVPSVLWGANVLGGAVNMVSRGLGADGAHTEVTAQGGSAAFRQGVVTHLGRRGGLSWVGSAGYAERDGFALPDAADLPYSQPDDDVRTNTDYRLANGFGRVAYRFGSGARAGLSLLHVDGEKGIAPESHVDPRVERVRYWRYPLWRTTLAVASGEAPLGAATDLRGALWISRFRQDIAAYSSAAYDERSDLQEDEDQTLGSRAVLQRRLRPVTLRLALNALTSEHHQQETTFRDDGAASAPALTYRQGLYSAGLEGEWAAQEGLRLSAGASLDALTTPETGDKPVRDPFVDWGATAGAVYRPAPRWTLTAALGRKTRFPTLRELFGEALQRFALNPDLRPESSVLA